MKLFVRLMFSFLCGCTHTVHNLEVEDQDEAVIASAVESQCGDRCWKRNCWWETEEVIVCSVYFSFVPGSKKRIYLSRIQSHLEGSDLKVGFCGFDSVGTHLTIAFVGGILGGLAAHAAGGNAGNGVQIGTAASSHYEVHPVYLNEELIVRACTTTPVAKDD